MRSPTAPDRALLEFQILRATISSRGTARLLLVPAGVVAWAALAIGTAAVITVALSTLIPLLALAAVFESSVALFLNVERIGRYLQVFHEEDPGWEHVAMAFGERFSGGADPVSGRLFIFATSVNFFPAALGGEPWEIVIVAACHFAFIYRIRRAQGIAATARADDLARFRTLRSSISPFGAAPSAGPTTDAERPKA